MPPRAGLNTETIVKTAMRIADEEGIEHLTLSRIASEYGVKSPSLYEHVKGIESLIALLKLSGLRIMAQQFQHAVIGVSGDDALRRLADSFRTFVMEHPSIYNLTVENSVNDSEEIRAASGEILDIIYTVLRSYKLPEQMLVHATRYLRSVLHGFVSLEKSGGFGMKEDKDESFALIRELMVSNIKNWH